MSSMVLVRVLAAMNFRFLLPNGMVILWLGSIVRRVVGRVVIEQRCKTFDGYDVIGQ
jgi:hypothetical protein